jgi:hypothetical protein
VTFDKALDLVEQLDLTRFRYPVRFRLTEELFDIGIAMLVELNDRDTGELQQAQIVGRISKAGLDERLLLRVLRQMLHEFARHEVDECLLVRGLRVYDPHLVDAMRREIEGHGARS